MVTEKRRYRVMHGGHGTAAGPVPAGGFVTMTKEEADRWNGPHEPKFVECVPGQPDPEFPPKPRRVEGASWGTVTGRFPATLGGE